MKIPDAKATVEKTETRENTSMAADESQKQERGDRWSKERRKNSTICVIDGHQSSQEFGVRATQFQKYKGRFLLRGDIAKDDSGSYAVFTEQSSSASQMTAAKVMDIISWLPGCAGQAADAVSAYTQVKNGRCIIFTKDPKVRMSRFLDTSTKTQMAEVMVQYGRSSGSSWAKSVRSSFSRTVMAKAIWENPVEILLGEGFQVGMLIRTPWWRMILICVCGWHQIGWEESKHWPIVESTYERSRLWRNNFIPGPRLFGRRTQRECETSKDILDNY